MLEVSGSDSQGSEDSPVWQAAPGQASRATTHGCFLGLGRQPSLLSDCSSTPASPAVACLPSGSLLELKALLSSVSPPHALRCRLCVCASFLWRCTGSLGHPGLAAQVPFPLFGPPGPPAAFLSDLGGQSAKPLLSALFTAWPAHSSHPWLDKWEQGYYWPLRSSHPFVGGNRARHTSASLPCNRWGSFPSESPKSAGFSELFNIAALARRMV